MTDKSAAGPDASRSLAPEAPKGLKVLKVAFQDRRTAAMLMLGFSAGLPAVLLIGTLNAWLSDAGVKVATIGVLSWIGLAYAFKFLWSPVVNTRLPLVGILGRRRGWLVVCQALVGLATAVIAFSHPDNPAALGALAVAAAVGAFASATQDIVVDTWRIEVAGERTPLDLLSSIYQLGFRTASLVGGAGALLLADAAGWQITFVIGAILMGVGIAGSLIAPEPEVPPAAVVAKERRGTSRLRNAALLVVLAAWAWAAFQIIAFMVKALTTEPAPSAGDFTAQMGPWIIGMAVLLPCLLAAFIAKRPSTASAAIDSMQGTADRLYDAVLAPLTEVMGRLGWAAILVLGVILSYRLTDGIWGPFAFPFYMGTEGGALGHTKTEVALASKTFGVIMTIVGIGIGGWLLLAIGRMATLMIGAVLAAATNLLFADLANGAPVIGGFMSVTGLYKLFGLFGIGEPMARLMLAIAGENTASGLAGAAFVAYLSALSNKLYGAVQFAVFSSLALLIGTLGRGALGEAIDTQGYAAVFMFAAGLGLIAVVFCGLEWIRVARERRLEAARQDGVTDGAGV